MIRTFRRPARRPGTATVEAAVVLSLIAIPMMVGVWEVGRLIQCQQIVANSAREGARIAAQGRTIRFDGDPIEINVSTGTPNVKDTVYLALVTGGLKEIAKTDLDVTYPDGKKAFDFQFINILPPESPDPYPTPAEPYQAKKTQQYTVTVRIPFNKVRWVNLGLINPKYVEYTVTWRSLVDKRFVVDPTLPSW